MASVSLSDRAVGEPLLSVKNLRVDFHTQQGRVSATRDVALDIRRGETLGVVGESGSGKTVTAYALMDLIPVTGEIVSAEYEWKGEPVDRQGLRRLRGSRITMVFQEPMSTMNPLATVGRQITEVLKKHKGMGRTEAKRRAIELLDLVGIPEPARRMRQYPFEFSGGMAQRAVIAMALAPEPDLLIADEPTTALDVTIQAQVLDLIADLQRDLGVAILLITHDLGVVAGLADRLAVMYAGRVVERGPTASLFASPKHPYTAALLQSTPNPHRVRDRLVAIRGSAPIVNDALGGCAFAPRCDFATDVCRDTRPELEPSVQSNGDVGRRREAACWHVV